MTTRWGAKITDTTKHSPKLRSILLKRSAYILAALQLLRRRAAAFASPESVCVLASCVELPQPADSEDRDLLENEPQDGIAKPSDVEKVDLQDDDPANLEAPTRPASPVVDFGNDENYSQGDFPRASADIGTYVPALIILWTNSFFAELGTLLDRLERDSWDGEPKVQAAALSCAEHIPDSSGADGMVTIQGLGGSSEQPISTQHPITTDQLLQLQALIRQVSRFRMYLARSLQEVQDAQYRIEARFLMRRVNGNITMVMKSKGDGSPLSESIAADEPWPSGEWGMPACGQPRRRLYEDQRVKRVKW